MEDMSLLSPLKRAVMEDMSLLRPQKRTRSELSIQATMEGASADERFRVSLPCSLGLEPCNPLADTELALADEELALPDEELTLADEELALADEELALSDEELALADEMLALPDEELAHSHKALALSDETLAHSRKALALSDETFAHSFKARASINSFFLGSPSFSDVNISINGFSSKIQSNLESQTQPQLQLQQQLVGLDLQNCYRQILLLSATDVIETLLLRLNHYLEEWKKARGLRFGPSIPSSYSDMVYKRHNSQLSPWFYEAMDYVESAFLRDLEMRGYGPAIELKEALRQDLTAFLLKAEGEGGRNDVAHPFSTSVKQHWKSPPQTPGKVKRLYGTAVGGLTQSQKDYALRILDLLSNSQNLPECYRDLAQVAFPLQIFFLRDVIEKSKVKVEIAGGQYSLCPS